MVELKILLSVEVDLSDLEELRVLIKKIKAVVWTGREKEVDDDQPRSESPQTAEYSEVNAVGGFGGKNTGKPDPWDGDTEQEFKNWSERFTTYVANAGDKVWRKILKELQVMGDDDDNLHDANDVKQELQHALYDQLTHYTKGELLADIQIAGSGMSFESYRKAFAQGTKKTAENVHRARNRVSRPEIAESLEDMEARYMQWKNYIAYLKDIDAYDFGEAGMISILLDFLPDEARKETASKHETTGHKSSTMKQEMIEVEKIIQRETDRKASRKDRKSVGEKKIAFAGEGTRHFNDDTQYAYIWDTSVHDEYGGFIMTVKRVREDVDEEDRQTKHRPDAIPEASTEPGKSKGKGAKGGKSKGLNPADRKCFLCGEEEHY